MVVFGGVMLLFAASQIEIPLQPVPITLQTVAVMLIGLTYTPRHALQSLLIWLGLAAAGLPVLSGFAGGFAYFGGPTLGYLVGFVISVYLMATFKQRFSLNSWTSDVMLCLMGTAILFSLGVAWLSRLIGLENAITHGVLPFILPGIVKAGLLCTALQIIRHYKRG
ncbi:MAG: biotin transporter BioY [Proteobacteria bacterium]|nr:biotin transporter BioY [Pseudomonadota bacterium]